MVFDLTTAFDDDPEELAKVGCIPGCCGDAIVTPVGNDEIVTVATWGSREAGCCAFVDASAAGPDDCNPGVTRNLVSISHI